jgi:N-hydroxyarylamine O-acetyltransferase
VDVDGYLKRIGAERPTGTGLADLAALHAAHPRTVPFEDYDIHLGEPLSLDLDDLEDKVVTRHRGGFCYELNGLFAALLTALGYEVSMLAAGVFGRDGSLSPIFDHMALLVELDERYLVDVGFGAHAVYPLRRDWPEAQEDPTGTFLVVDAPGGDVDVLMNGERQYRAETRPRRLADFERPCWWHANSPDSHFRIVPRCSRPTEHGRVTIVGDRLYETVHGERTETALASEAELLTAYEKHFGMRLPKAPTC